MPQQPHSKLKRTATPGKAGKLLFPQAREIDMLSDGFQSAIFLWRPGLFPTVQLTFQEWCLAFKAQAADAASCLPGAAAACCCPMLLLFGNQTLLHSQVMSLAQRDFKMRLAH